MATQRRKRMKIERYDHRPTFQLLNRTSRLMRELEAPLREAERAKRHQKKIDNWTYTLKTNPPGSFWHWWATVRIGYLLNADPYRRTLRDVLADGLYEVWLELRTILWGLGYTVLLVVAYALWVWFLLFVALPVLWDWFWRIPPGLQ